MAYWEEEDDEEEEEGEGYLASYSDLVTDLMAVFVLLLSFALMSQGIKVKKAAQEMAEEMAEEVIAEQLAQAGINPEDVLATAFPDASETSSLTVEPTLSTSGASITLVSEETIEVESIDALYEAIKQYIDTSGLNEDLSVAKQSDKLILLRVHSSVFFELGSADISPSADSVLEDVCKIFIEYDKHIKMMGIEGHTDNLPIKTAQFDSNWELSTARAVNVVRRMIDVSGLDPAKFSAVGLGEFHPVADNETEEGRAQNRRVDFLIETSGD